MDRERAGDAVAFSVEVVQRGGPQRRSRNRMALPQCLLRVERRRSDRHAWDRVVDELMQVQPLQFVTRLERHRYDYRLSLRSCEDPLALALPSELHVSRIQSSAGYQHPHVGTFQLLKMKKPNRDAAESANHTSRSIVSSLVVVATVICVCLFILTKRKMLEWPRSKWKAFMLSTKSQTQGSMVQAHSKTPIDTPSSTEADTVGSPRKILVFDDFDEDDSEEASAAKELLMTELPEFNDENGWRDFFDSQIYRREDRQKQPESQEGSGVVRQQRKIITRSSNTMESKPTDRPAKSVTTTRGNQAVYSSPRPLPDKKLDAVSESPAPNLPVVSSASKLSAVRQLNGCNGRSETVDSFSAAPSASSTSTKHQPSRIIRPSTPPDDFGEFWQM